MDVCVCAYTRVATYPWLSILSLTHTVRKAETASAKDKPSLQARRTNRNPRGVLSALRPPASLCFSTIFLFLIFFYLFRRFFPLLLSLLFPSAPALPSRLCLYLKNGVFLWSGSSCFREHVAQLTKETGKKGGGKGRREGDERRIRRRRIKQGGNERGTGKVGLKHTIWERERESTNFLSIGKSSQTNFLPD